MVQPILNHVNTPKHLYEFEEKMFSDGFLLSICGFNIFQILKIHIFYKEISSSDSSSDLDKREIVRLSKFALLWEGIVLLFHCVIRTLYTHKGWVFISSVSKFSKNKKGLYKNEQIDYIVSKIKNKPIVIETPLNGKIITPAVTSYDYSINIFYILAYAIRKILNLFKINEEKVKIFTNYYVNYCSEKGYTTKADYKFNYDNVLNFMSYYYAGLLIFHVAKPSYIISAEMIDFGLLVAAQQRGIKVVEIQHGSIDEFYPPYIWNRKYEDMHKKVLKPYKLVLFGNLAKEIVIKNSYIKESDIFLAGSNLIDNLRKSSASVSLTNCISLIFQPYMHETNLSLLKTLVKSIPSTIYVIIKAHPLQANTEIADYMTEIENIENFKMLDKSVGIAELIQQTDLMVGCLSTSLEEMLSTGKPAITLATTECPLGIHSMTGASQIKEAIRPYSMESIARAVQQFYEDAKFRDNWYRQAHEHQYFIYEYDYMENLDRLLNLL